nr:hypothetical protein [Clostridioides sp.]
MEEELTCTDLNLYYYFLDEIKKSDYTALQHLETCIDDLAKKEESKK